MRWRMIGQLMVGGIGVAAIFAFGLSRGHWRMNHPSPRVFPVWGVDVSHHQGRIDWATVARTPQLGFAYLKATEGGDWVDPWFVANWLSARKAGLRVGGYHFFTFCRPALEQAQHFLRTLPPGADTLPPAVDVELGGNCATIPPDPAVQAALAVWVEVVAEATGREPVIYATHEAYDRFLRSDRLQRRVWIRDVWKQPHLPQREPWALWQFDARGRVAGIPTFVDLDVFQGTQVQLQRF